MTITGMPAASDPDLRCSPSGAGPSTATGSADVRDPAGPADGSASGHHDVDAGPVVRRYASPVGELVLIAGPAGLAAVLWPDDDRPVRVGPGIDARTLVAAETATRSADGPPTADGAAAPSNDATPPHASAGMSTQVSAGMSGETSAETSTQVSAGMSGETSAETSAGDTAPAQAVLDETARQLDEYFAGTRQSFDLPLDPVGTEFQVAVWRSLADIAYGETSTYGEQAARIGRPTAVRAVGAANGRNPLSIVLPCHRVVGSDGRLTGFAGGLAAKALLLDHEARHRRR